MLKLNRLAMNLGWALGSSLGGILAAINYHLLFWTEGLVYILVRGLIFILLPPVKQTEKAVKAAQPVAGASSPWKDAFLLRFLILVAIYCTFFHLLFRLVPVYWARRRSIDNGTVWICGIVGWLGGIVFGVCGGV